MDSGERKKRQVIIALTANSSEELNELVPTIFDHICTKPISSQDLRNVMKKFCRTNDITADLIPADIVWNNKIG